MASHALELGLDHAGHISAAPAGSVLGSDQKEGHGETGQGVEAEGTCSSLCVPVPVSAQQDLFGSAVAVG